MTKQDKLTIFHALRSAIDYDLGLADAHHNKGHIAKECFKNIRKYERLRTKLGAELGISLKTPLDLAIDDGELLTIAELKARSK